MLRKLLIPVLVIGLFIAACSKEAEQAKPMEGKIVFIQGKVQKSSDGKTWADLSLNQPILANDWIKTSNKSMAKVSMWSASEFVVKPNSIIQVKELASGQKFEAQVKVGGVACSVEKLKANGAYYKVSGVAIAAGVRGTKFDVYTDGKKEYLKVNEGTVAAKRNIEGAKEQLVSAGKVMAVSVKENEALKKKIQGKTKEEIEKILEVPLQEERDIEKELPEGMREEIGKMEKFTEEKSQAVEKHEQETSKKIDETVNKKSQEIDKMMKGKDLTDESADDMLSAAKKKKAQKK